MEIVNKISNVKTNPKTDKPADDITVINIKAKWLLGKKVMQLQRRMMGGYSTHVNQRMYCNYMYV